MTHFDRSAYLARIGLTNVPATAAGLAALQAAQLAAVPFENIDPLMGIEPALAPEAIWDKIVAGRRGGYCFELNSLLGAALSEFGFPARRVMARVRMGAPEGGPRSHLAWIAEAEGRRFLVDAGFGGPGALAPLALDAREEQPRPNGIYRIRDDEATGEHVVEMRAGDGWFTLFGFDDAERVTDPDIAAANHLCANWPEMPFPSHLMMNGYSGRTRIGVFDRTVTEQVPEGSTRRELSDPTEFAALLRDVFALRLDPGTVQRVWDRLAPSAEVAAQ